jgi:hypothetical protein
MIYILAVLLPPLALLLNGQPFSAVLNLILIVPCILLGFFFPLLWLVPSAHGVIAIYMKRDKRRHEERARYALARDLDYRLPHPVHKVHH